MTKFDDWATGQTAGIIFEALPHDKMGLAITEDGVMIQIRGLAKAGIQDMRSLAELLFTGAYAISRRNLLEADTSEARCFSCKVRLSIDKAVVHLDSFKTHSVVPIYVGRHRING